MGSSSGDDYSVPPQNPAPPGNLISPMGTSTPDPGWQGMNFLGNHTSTLADMAQLEPQFTAMSAPPAAAAPAAAATTAAHAPAAPPMTRDQLAAAVAQQTGRRPGTFRVMMPGEQMPRNTQFAGGDHAYGGRSTGGYGSSGRPM